MAEGRVRGLVALALVAGAIGLAWLPGSAADGPAVIQLPGSAADGPVVIQLTDRLTFDPPAVTVRVGQSVRWHNASVMVHTVTGDPSKARVEGSARLPKGAKPFDSGNLKPDSSFTHMFTVAGEYGYFCIPHEGAKMRATVHVVAKHMDR